MGFPPNFSNVWDITFPPDTQLANQLGQDLRTFRNDVMQRMSIISGTLANRPTPEESPVASWGGVGYGLLYFATDNGKIYQWTGFPPAWVDVTANFFSGGNSFLSFFVANGSTGINIPANALAVGSIVKAYLQGSVSHGGTLNLSIGGTVVASFTNPSSFSLATFQEVNLECTAIGGAGGLIAQGSTSAFAVDTTNPIPVIFTSTSGGTVLYGPGKVLIFP